MPFILINYYRTSLTAAMTSTQTTMDVASTTGLPTLASGDILPLVLTDAATGQVHEIVYVTAISGSTLTIERSQEGTTAQSWLVGDYVSCDTTAGTILTSNSLSATTETLTVTGTAVVPAALDSGEVVNLGQIQAISIADLESAPVPSLDGASIRVLGYASEGDGGGGVFYWNASSSATADGATIVLPSGYSGTGRWYREFTGSVNVKWWGADQTGVTDSSVSIQDAHNYAVANHLLSVYFPPGTYLTNTTIDWSPLIMGWTDGDVLWETSSTTNTMMIYISTRWGNSANAGFTVPAVFNGKFHFKLTATNTSIAGLYVGDATSGSGYGATNITFSHLQIDGFEYNVQFSNTAYMVNFNHCYFMNGSYHLYTAASLTNTGERFSFTDCTFTQVSVNVLTFNSPLECRFINCSIDYNAGICSDFSGSNLYFDNCHIEWNEAVSLCNNVGANITTLVVFDGCIFNFAGNSSPANPLIFQIGPETFVNVINPRFMLADSGLTLFNLYASTATFFGPSIFAISGNSVGTYVANTGGGTLHTF